MPRRRRKYAFNVPSDDTRGRVGRVIPRSRWIARHREIRDPFCWNLITFPEPTCWTWTGEEEMCRRIKLATSNATPRRESFMLNDATCARCFLGTWDEGHRLKSWFYGRFFLFECVSSETIIWVEAFSDTMVKLFNFIFLSIWAAPKHCRCRCSHIIWVSLSSRCFRYC